MKDLRQISWMFVQAVAILLMLSACAGMENQNAPSTSTLIVLPVTQIDKPGVISADTAPIRVGPGLAFEPAITVDRGQGISVIGRSQDGKWYKVEVPGYSASPSALWIAVDFVDLISETDLPTMTDVSSSSTPSEVFTSTEIFTPVETVTVTEVTQSPVPTLQSSTLSCKPPAGWVVYIVRSGDNLSKLAVRTGTSVERIKAANCLTSEVITTGMSLYLPPANIPIPIQTPLPSDTAVPIFTVTAIEPTRAIAPPTDTSTGTARPIDTVPDTNTASAYTPTPRPIDTVQDTNTAATQGPPGTP